jgi:hypothetical protein
VDFSKSQETMPVAAVIDESRLKRRLHAGDFGKVDVSGKLAFVYGLKVEFFNLVSVNHDHAGFFRVGGVDEHFLRHINPLRPARKGRSGGPERRANMSGRLVRAAARNAKRRAMPGGHPSQQIANVAHIIAVHVWATCIAHL